jgi:RNA polymerase sigma factor (sigma-70 family)
VSSLSDIELMGLVRDGEVRQLAFLFERHHLKLYNFYLRMTGERLASEDMVQEVFFRILKYRRTFRGDGEFAAWMYHLARNVQRDLYKKRKMEPADEMQLDNLASEEPHAQEALERRQEKDLLREALRRLPFEKREILILSRYQDLRYEVIGGILGCSEEAVKVRVHRATNELRTVYFELSGEKAHE